MRRLFLFTLLFVAWPGSAFAQPGNYGSSTTYTILNAAGGGFLGLLLCDSIIAEAIDLGFLALILKLHVFIRTP